jgi:adenine/guanine phosphoribosyltransferase-like PRPP-binding protein
MGAGGTSVIVIAGAFADASAAVAELVWQPGDRRVAVLPRAALDERARTLLREADVECITTLAGESMEGAAWLCHELALTMGWRLDDAMPPLPVDRPPRDVIGWYEVRVRHEGMLVTADRPITRLHGSQTYIASFNLLGQTRLNRALGELMHRRLTDEGLAPGAAFDTLVCAESKAVGMAQVLAEQGGIDRFVVLRKGVKNYMPRRPDPPLVEEAASITTAGAQALVLDPNDWPLLEGRRALLVDDVIATGGTARAACALLARAGARVAAVVTVLLKGPPPDLPGLIALARPLL